MKPDQILAKLGLTKDQVAKHVVRIEPPLPVWKNKTRAKYLVMGLTAHGLPRKK